MRLIPPRITIATKLAVISPIIPCMIDIWESAPKTVNVFVAIIKPSFPNKFANWLYTCCVNVFD